MFPKMIYKVFCFDLIQLSIDTPFFQLNLLLPLYIMTHLHCCSHFKSLVLREIVITTIQE